MLSPKYFGTLCFLASYCCHFNFNKMGDWYSFNIKSCQYAAIQYKWRRR